jgi:hypothetical protein
MSAGRVKKIKKTTQVERIKKLVFAPTGLFTGQV